jgi:hypothetical protein
VRILRKRLTLGTLFGAVAVMMIPTAAYAAYYGKETNIADLTYIQGAGSCYRIGVYGSAMCFQPDGDYLYVYDGNDDGYSTAVEWKIPDPNSTEDRSGSCVNKLGHGNWGVCNKDFPEDKAVYIRLSVYNNGDPVSGGTGLIDWIPVAN